MIEKLEIVQQRFTEVSDLIIQPDIIADQKRYVQLNREYKDLNKVVENFHIRSQPHTRAAVSDCSFCVALFGHNQDTSQCACSAAHSYLSMPSLFKLLS